MVGDQFVQLLAAVGCQMADEWSPKDHVACVIRYEYTVCYNVARCNRIRNLESNGGAYWWLSPTLICLEQPH